MSARDDHARAKQRPVAMILGLLPNFTGHPATVITPEPPQATYADARTEGLAVLAGLGAEAPPDGILAEVGDLIRQGYALGWAACEKRVLSTDTADAIAVAIETPKKVCDEPPYIGRSELRWQVMAVQRAAVYGIPKELAGGGEPP